jgi:hypothetical protein
MGDKQPDSKEKIILPENLQREMMKFFLKTSMPKIAATDKEKQQAPKIPDKGH